MLVHGLVHNTRQVWRAIFLTSRIYAIAACEVKRSRDESLWSIVLLCHDWGSLNSSHALLSRRYQIEVYRARFSSVLATCALRRLPIVSLLPLHVEQSVYLGLHFY